MLRLRVTMLVLLRLLRPRCRLLLRLRLAVKRSLGCAVDVVDAVGSVRLARNRRGILGIVFAWCLVGWLVGRWSRKWGVSNFEPNIVVVH